MKAAASVGSTLALLVVVITGCGASDSDAESVGEAASHVERACPAESECKLDAWFTFTDGCSSGTYCKEIEGCAGKGRCEALGPHCDIFGDPWDPRSCTDDGRPPPK